MFPQHLADNYQVNERLLDYIQNGPVWRLHALLRALALTSHEHIVYNLGFDQDVYCTEENVESDEEKHENDTSGKGWLSLFSPTVIQGKIWFKN